MQMADINQTMQDLVNAAKNLNDARAEEETSRKDEEKKLEAWKAATKKVMKAQGKEAVEKAGRECRAAEEAWKAANTRSKKATLKRMEVEKKTRKALKQFNEAIMKLIFP
jgi:hypothetical protein